ncbi:MAG: aspartate carbamoyltransferase regulatory subunit [Bacteroidaceae bacterium]|nr:aspartate carbamoyltransferase regulatory subunit [Bacteroidaceae bacterium]
MKRQEMQVAALQNGTVIDHIPSSKLFQVVNLLHLDKEDTSVTIGFNLKSEKMGSKSIIKIADKFFSDEELNQLSVIAPNVTLCIIHDYEVVEKKKVQMPQELTGVIRCPNPKCITNNEPMPTHFHVLDKENGILQCHYCNREVTLEQVKLI